MVCRYDHFESSVKSTGVVPKASLCFDLPYWRNTTDFLGKPASVMANFTHSLSVAGNCVFIGMLGSPGTEGVSYTTGGALVKTYYIV